MAKTPLNRQVLLLFYNTACSLVLNIVISVHRDYYTITFFNLINQVSYHR